MLSVQRVPFLAAVASPMTRHIAEWLLAIITDVHSARPAAPAAKAVAGIAGCTCKALTPEATQIPMLILRMAGVAEPFAVGIVPSIRITATGATRSQRRRCRRRCSRLCAGP